MPDLNVWLALSWANHRHSQTAWAWFAELSDSDAVFFCRMSQIGMLRLLTTSAIMGRDVLTIGEAWKVYDRWLQDTRTGLRQDPVIVEELLRASTRPLSKLASPKALGDCYLMAISQSLGTTLVTLDKALATVCRKAKHPVVLLD